MNATHAASDMHVAPTAHFSDGLMELYFVRKIPKLSMLSLLLNIEAGTHMDNEHMARLRVKAIRITPHDARISNIAVDGERVPCKPIEIRVFRGVLNLLAR
jgi:diacylglycerol kinase family enzyme